MFKALLSLILAAFLVAAPAFAVTFSGNNPAAAPMRFVTVTDGAVITSEFCGKTLTNTGASGTIEVDLASDLPIGCTLGFIAMAAQDFNIDPPATARISAGGPTVTNAVGDRLQLDTASQFCSATLVKVSATSFVMVGGTGIPGFCLVDAN